MSYFRKMLEPRARPSGESLEKFWPWAGSPRFWNTLKLPNLDACAGLKAEERPPTLFFLELLLFTMKAETFGEQPVRA